MISSQYLCELQLCTMTYSLFLIIFCISTGLATGTNLSCYQCVRRTNQECTQHDLVLCSSHYDRCVTHIENNDKTGYVIKRECGLGPCAFEDHMANRGLGLDACDRSKSDYFCVSCCRTNGCNQSSADRSTISPAIYALNFSFLITLRHFI